MGKPIYGKIGKSMMPRIRLRTKCIILFPNEQDYFPERVFTQQALKKIKKLSTSIF
jgi:hypothetical protein